MPADVIEKANLPNLHSPIAKEGGYARVMVGGEKGTYSQTPTIYDSYNSILTGTWVNKHNVWDNDIRAPDYNYKNIFRILKENHPRKPSGFFPPGRTIEQNLLVKVCLKQVT